MTKLLKTQPVCSTDFELNQSAPQLVNRNLQDTEEKFRTRKPITLKTSGHTAAIQQQLETDSFSLLHPWALRKKRIYCLSLESLFHLPSIIV